MERAWATAVIREYAAGSLAGLIVGVVVGGIGGRVVMRVAGALSDPVLIGQLTSNGNVVGDITLGGTVALIIFVGALPGIFGGLLYAAVRPWLAPLGRWQGVAFGLLLLAALGSVVIDPANFDFGRFGSVGLNTFLFSALFVVFGALMPQSFERIDRAARGEAATAQALLFGGTLCGLGVLVLLIVSLVGSIVNRGEGAEAAALFFVVAVPVLLVAVIARLYAGGATAMSYALLALPLLVGLQRTASGIFTMLAR